MLTFLLFLDQHFYVRSLNSKLFTIVKNFYQDKQLNFNYFIGHVQHDFISTIMNSVLPPELIIMFIQSGIDLNYTNNNYGNTPLLWNISNARNKQAKLIIEEGYQYQKDKMNLNIISPVFGTAPIHLIVGKGYRKTSASNKALDVSNLTLFQGLLKANANVNLPTDKISKYGGNTALHIACARRDSEFVVELLNCGADQTIKNLAGQTAFDMLYISKQEAEALVNALTGGQNNFNSIYDKADIYNIVDMLLNHQPGETKEAAIQNIYTFFQPAALPSPAPSIFIDRPYDSLPLKFCQFLSERTQDARNAHDFCPAPRDYWTNIMTDSDKANLFKAFETMITSEYHITSEELKQF